MNRRYKYFERNVVPQLLYTLSENYDNQLAGSLTYQSGDFKYKYVQEWAKFPEELWGNVISGITCDLKGNIYATLRDKDNPIIKFDSEGNFVKTFGRNLPIGKLHGITIDEDNNVWVTDDQKHVAFKVDQEGNLLKQIGNINEPSDSGYRVDYVDPSDKSKPLVIKAYDAEGNLVEKLISNSAYMSISKRALPFNKPTKLLTYKNRLYASDGYGNCAVHVFDLEGNLLFSFGAPGNGQGEFRTVHSLWIDSKERILVADRDNNRVQVFDLEGNFIKTIEDLWYPVDVFSDNNNIYILQNDGLVGIYDYDFNVVAEIGHWQSGNMVAHAFTGDDKGNLYLADCGVKGIFKLERIGG